MDNGIPGEYADAFSPEPAGIVDEVGRHELVSMQKVIYRVGIQGREEFICLKSVFDFPDLTWGSQNMFPLDDIGYLFKSEGIVFDGKGGMDGEDPVGVVETGIPAHIDPDGERPDTPADFSDPFDHGVGDGERGVGSCCHYLLSIGFGG